jgi:hypothetical protein
MMEREINKALGNLKNGKLDLSKMLVILNSIQAVITQDITYSHDFGLFLQIKNI